ncbi:hypothetical protein ACLKA6_012981 [Drosophila palustris]
MDRLKDKQVNALSKQMAEQVKQKKKEVQKEERNPRNHLDPHPVCPAKEVKVQLRENPGHPITKDLNQRLLATRKSSRRVKFE